MCYQPGGDNRYGAILEQKVCNAVCPSDMAVCLTALNATLTVQGTGGTKEVAMKGKGGVKRRAMTGTCPKCGTKMFRIMGKA